MSFKKDKIEAIDHKNPPPPHTHEKLEALNKAQAAKDATPAPTAPPKTTN